MKCNTNKLFNYIDGILSDADIKVFQEHLKDCESCRATIDTFKLMETVGEHHCDIEIDFVQSVRNLTDDELYSNKKYLLLNKFLSNKNKFIKYASVATMALVITAGIVSNNKFDVVKNSKESTLGSPKQESKVAKQDDNIIKDAALLESITYKMGEEVYLGNFVYKVNSAIKTKKRGNFPTPTRREKLSFDKEGNLIDDNSYVIVNLTIKNVSEKTKELCFSDIRLSSLNDDGNFPSTECVSRSKLDEYGRSNYFIVKLNPKEEYNLDLAYADNDEFLENNDLGLHIYGAQVRSIGEGAGRIRHIKIEYKEQ